MIVFIIVFGFSFQTFAKQSSTLQNTKQDTKNELSHYRLNTLGGYTPPSWQLPQWAILGYYANQDSRSVLLKLWEANGHVTHLFVISVQKRLSKNNIITRIFTPLFRSVDAAVNGVYRAKDPQGPIYGGDAYLIFRWGPLHWGNVLVNTLGIGEGISYNTKAPTGETFLPDTPHKLLNYLMFEITYGVPQYPNWQLVLRVHHRSGVFGLYGTKHSGSTAIGVGIRYLFDQWPSFP